MDIYFETNHINKLIYILIHMEVKNNKNVIYQEIGLSLMLCYLTI